MPEHDPQVGQADCSIAITSSSVYCSSAAATIASTRSSATSLPRRTTLPASIGPPETKMAGTLMRSAAISLPGVLLSQWELQILAPAPDRTSVGKGKGVGG